MPTFSTEEDKAALVGAIKAVEARTSAELVICVRRQSGRYLHADLLTAITAGLATLACLLYLPIDFELASFLVDPLIVAIVAGSMCSRLPGLRRALTRPSVRAEAVRDHAHATFFDKGIRRTSDRIGILLYISLLERRAEIVVDDGITRAVPDQDWARAVALVLDAVGSGHPTAELCQAIEGLAEVLEPCLPRSEDDVNELADEVHP